MLGAPATVTWNSTLARAVRKSATAPVWTADCAFSETIGLTTPADTNHPESVKSPAPCTAAPREGIGMAPPVLGTVGVCEAIATTFTVGLVPPTTAVQRARSFEKGIRPVVNMTSPVVLVLVTSTDQLVPSKVPSSTTVQEVGAQIGRAHV